MHMGLHILSGLPGTTQLHQLILPGLEERARFFPAIETREQLSAGSVLLQLANRTLPS